MNLFLRTFVAAVLFIPCLRTIGQQESNYKIYHGNSGQVVSLREMLDYLRDADVVFVGEEHDDSIAHQMEMTIFEALYGYHGAQLGLSMEMFDRDAQVVLNEYLNGQIKEGQFKKDARVWSNYDDYRPLVEYAKTNKIPVVAANAPMRYASIAGRKTQTGLLELSPTALKWIAPLPIDTAEGAYYEKLREVMGYNMHDSTGAMAGMMPKSLNGQSVWDATMAWSVAEFRKAHKTKHVLHLNGRFHTDEHFGIFQQYSNYRKKDSALVVSIQADPAFPNHVVNDALLKQGDFVIVTDGTIPKSMD